ncbi:MAG TPA: M48 family metalloprotease [Phycisphaerae bacterium]|nr:M48 family metalloprotease [Phycisphaerae bacterium]
MLRHIGRGALFLLAIMVPFAVHAGPHWWVWAIPAVLAACGIDSLALGIRVPSRPLNEIGFSGEEIGALRELASRLGVQEVRVALLPPDDPAGAPRVGCLSKGRAAIVCCTEDLPSRLTAREMKVVFAHELAHHRLGHARKSSWLGFALKFAAAMIVCFCLDLLHPFLGSGWSARLIAVTLALWQVFYGLGLPVRKAYSRHQERQALRKALEVTDDGEAFVSAMRKMAGREAAGAEPTLLDKLLFNDHPSLRETLAMAEDYASRRALPPNSPARQA